MPMSTACTGAIFRLAELPRFPPDNPEKRIVYILIISWSSVFSESNHDLVQGTLKMLQLKTLVLERCRDTE
jgi:hypothetical protein